MKINLIGGDFALVDEEDFARLAAFRWSVMKRGRNKYAKRHEEGRGGRSTFLMHREVMGATHRDGVIFDHRNHNGLDNRKENIRRCTHQQNSGNSRKNPLIPTTSIYKGVSLIKESGKWQAYIRVNGVLRKRGRFFSEVDAARAYNAAAEEYFGEFALLNDVDPQTVAPAW